MPISWDEICWVHDIHGFADCGLVIYGKFQRICDMTLVNEPDFTIDPAYKDKRAEPVGAWS